MTWKNKHPLFRLAVDGWKPDLLCSTSYPSWQKNYLNINGDHVKQSKKVKQEDNTDSELDPQSKNDYGTLIESTTTATRSPAIILLDESENPPVVTPTRNSPTTTGADTKLTPTQSSPTIANTDAKLMPTQSSPTTADIDTELMPTQSSPATADADTKFMPTQSSPTIADTDTKLTPTQNSSTTANTDTEHYSIVSPPDAHEVEPLSPSVPSIPSQLPVLLINSL
ncbi:hypothetical protein BDR04DRAFT_1151048 [Suillus decipiens]|nr:hypothetical protein BDR04DRAFT_1151048 [Suillus decipiens]